MSDLRARPAPDIYSAKEPTLIVVPTYNEKSSIAELIPQFFSFVKDVHLLVVDDNSPDGTAEIVESFKPRYSHLDVLRRKGERGLGRAYLAGIAYGIKNGFEIIGTMDADLSHDPAYLPRQLTLLEHHDVIIGSRYIRDGGTINWQLWRILLSWLANKYAAKLLGIPAHDVTSGYRLYRRNALKWLEHENVRSSGYSFLVELLYHAHRSGANIAESPIVFYDRTMEASKLRSREIYLGAFNLIRLRLSAFQRNRAAK